MLGEPGAPGFGMFEPDDGQAVTWHGVGRFRPVEPSKSGCHRAGERGLDSHPEHGAGP